MDVYKGVIVLDLYYCNYIYLYVGIFIDFCVYYVEISDIIDIECNVVVSVFYCCMIFVLVRNLIKNIRWYVFLLYVSFYYFLSCFNG